MRAIKNYLPGQRVKILDKTTLLLAGYEDNKDPEDFLNLLSGKEVTIQETYEDGQIYTCKEFPLVAIYKVFISGLAEKDKLTFKDIGQMIGLSTEPTRRSYNAAIKHIKDFLKTSNTLKIDMEVSIYE
jgi:hypothetical protein